MSRENCRYQLNTHQTLDNTEIDPIWKMFVEYHTSKEFYKEVETIFGRERLKKFRILKKTNYDNLGHGIRKHPVELNKNSKKIVGKNRSKNYKNIKHKLEIANTVKYEKNTFVLFLNDINAIHEVTSRDANPISRRLVNIIGEYYK